MSDPDYIAEARDAADDYLHSIDPDRILTEREREIKREGFVSGYLAGALFGLERARKVLS